MTWYINRSDSYGNHDTVDEFESRDEALAMRAEYEMSDPSGEYTTTTRPLPGWEY